jgi:hypothetical protein
LNPESHIHLKYMGLKMIWRLKCPSFQPKPAHNLKAVGSNILQNDTRRGGKTPLARRMPFSGFGGAFVFQGTGFTP